MRSNIKPLNEWVYHLKQKKVYEIIRHSQSEIIPESIEKFARLTDPAYLGDQGQLKIKCGKEFVTLGYV